MVTDGEHGCGRVPRCDRGTATWKGPCKMGCRTGRNGSRLGPLGPHLRCTPCLNGARPLPRTGDATNAGAPRLLKATACGRTVPGRPARARGATGVRPAVGRTARIEPACTDTIRGRLRAARDGTTVVSKGNTDVMPRRHDVQSRSPEGHGMAADRAATWLKARSPPSHPWKGRSAFLRCLLCCCGSASGSLSEVEVREL